METSIGYVLFLMWISFMGGLALHDKFKKEYDKFFG